MPIYEYRCERGHTFEVMQRMTEDALSSCTVCQAPVQRVFHPVAVHFKGSGFYNTDYGKKSKAAPSEGGSSAKPDSKGESKPESKSSSSSESKASSTSSSSD